MTVLTDARRVLRERGYVCADAHDGALLFSGPLGCGRVDATPSGRLRLGYDVSAAANDPLAFARISSRPGPARIALRRRAPVAERICDVGDLGNALVGLAGLWAPTADPPPPVIDVRTGVLTAVAPQVTAPLFLRLAAPGGGAVDRARATFLLVANVDLQSGKGGWMDGPGFTVQPDRSDLDRLSAELFEVGTTLMALGDERIAQSYLDLCGMRPRTQPRVPTGGANTEGGSV